MSMSSLNDSSFNHYLFREPSLLVNLSLCARLNNGEILLIIFSEFLSNKTRQREKRVHSSYQAIISTTKFG